MSRIFNVISNTLINIPNFNIIVLYAFKPAHQEAVSSTDPDANLGELIIRIPSEAQHLMTEGRSLRIGIEFSLEQPAGGLHFVVPAGEGSLAEVCISNLISFTLNSSALKTILCLAMRSHVFLRLGEFIAFMVSLHRFIFRGRNKWLIFNFFIAFQYKRWIFNTRSVRGNSSSL